MVLAEIKVFYLALFIGFLLMVQIIAVMKQYKKCGPDEALIRTGLGGAQVVFDRGTIVVPVIHRHEIINIAARQLEFSAEITTQDGHTQNIKCIFVVRISKTVDDVLSVVSMVGVETLADNAALLKLFEHKFTEYIQVVAKIFTKEELDKSHMNFKERVLDIIGTDLNGLSLEDMSLIIPSP